MKILINSKHLLNILSKVDWDNDIISEISCSYKRVLFFAKNKIVEINKDCIVLNKSDKKYNVSDYLWDLLINDLNQLSDQPIIFEVSEDRLLLTLEY